MQSVTVLTDMTMVLAHELSASTLELERSPLVAARPYFAHQIGDAAASLLAEVADVQLLARQGYFSKLEALAVLGTARTSATELKSLLRAATLRGYLTGDQTAPLMTRADEVVACVLAMKGTLRATALRGAA